MSTQLKPMVKVGRCWNGAQNDRGRVVHAVSGGSAGDSLCGTQPGARSYGWGDASDNILTCPKCLSKWRKLFLAGGVK